jgi:hypothetical protein
MSGNWLDLSSTSNRYIQTYVKGFVDISGGNLILRDKSNIYLQKGDISLNGILLVAGDVSLNSKLTVAGALNANGGITCDTDKFTVADNTGNTSIAGTLGVTGATILGGTLTANGGITIGASVAISGGSTTVGTSNLSVYGLTTGVGGITIQSTGAISGGSTTVVSSNLSVYGLTTGAGGITMNNNNIILGTGSISGGSTGGSSNLSVYGLTTGAGGITIPSNGTLTANGNVGIRKAPTTYALDVDGTVNATSFNASSDYRIKSNIVPLSETGFKVDLLKPVFYFNKQIKKNDIGFIAHEVSEHFPFLVSRNKDEEEYQSLNYIGIIGLLTNEIIEIKKRNKIIDEELIEIKNKINKMI